MRPAWLPAQSIAPPPSARDACFPRPRSTASRPPSPAHAMTSPCDTMVHSARQHLSSSHGQSQADDPEPPALVSLRDFMDSFPLVPLSIIPRLSLTDLVECEAGLLRLYQSLAIETNTDDAQLAKYTTRQIGLVQRQLEQTRARERVLKLLSGQEPTVESLTMTTGSCSKSTKALPVFLQPLTPSPRHPEPAGAKCLPPPSLAPAKSTPSLGLKKPSSSCQLSKAKAIAKATVSTAFVITTSETSMKARQKRGKKKSTEQREAERARQLEREKEQRRQAAYQRLLARQELQAKKKWKSKEQAAAVKQPAGNFVAVAEAPAVENLPDDADSRSSSDESDVSNCSETDAADEQAILDMPVPVQLDEGPMETAEEHSLVDDPRDETDDPSDEEEEPARASRDLYADRAVGGGAGTEEDKEQALLVTSDGRPEVDDISPSSMTLSSERAVVDLPETINQADAIASMGYRDQPVESEERQEQRVRDEIARRLQRFMAERTQSTLEQLHTRHAEKIGSAHNQQLEAAAASTPPTSAMPPSPLEPQRSPRAPVEPERESGSTPPRTMAIKSPPPSPTKKRPLPPPATSTTRGVQQPPPPTTQSIPRPVGRDVQEYRSYFANFFCILTSVYEQRVAFTSGSNGSSSSLISTNSTNAAHASDQALRLQLKLYQGWESIMNDYATVFGNSIPTPSGLFSSASNPASSSSTAHYRINSQTRKEVSDIVVTALEKLGDWDEHPSGLGLKTTWNLLWTWSKPNVERKTLLVWQKVNHFQHAKALTRKDCLKKNIGKYQAVGGRLKQAYDIVPASFVLPNEYVAFVQAFQERAKRVPQGKNIWIMKPVALSRGRGISLVNDLADVVYGEQVVIQEYIANPLLLDGFKFDLRLYVLVTSFNPLEAFFYEEGFVRMCTRAYEDSDLSNLFIHLTNSSIQKENQDAIAANPSNPINSANGDDAGGTKMTLAYLWKRLEAMGADVTVVKNDILTVILKALLCGEDHIPFQVNSFDLYGYDILLDTNFRPWLIEINSSPSMARENELDFQVKDALIYDTLQLVDPLHFDRSKLVDVVARRFQEAETDKKRSHANTRHPREAEELAARQLNEDLSEILRGRVPREYGEMPAHTGSYTRIAPHTTIHNQLVKLKKSCLRLDRK